MTTFEEGLLNSLAPWAPPGSDLQKYTSALMFIGSVVPPGTDEATARRITWPPHQITENTSETRRTRPRRPTS